MLTIEVILALDNAHRDDSGIEFLGKLLSEPLRHRNPGRPGTRSVRTLFVVPSKRIAPVAITDPRQELLSAFRRKYRPG